MFVKCAKNLIVVYKEIYLKMGKRGLILAIVAPFIYFLYDWRNARRNIKAMVELLSEDVYFSKEFKEAVKGELEEDFIFIADSKIAREIYPKAWKNGYGELVISKGTFLW